MTGSAAASPGAQPPSFGAILLAGGRATRMGGIDKTRLTVSGRTLVETALAAVSGLGCSPVTVVGPPPDDETARSHPAVRWLREDPPFGGPAAAVVTAMAETADVTSPEWMLVLACDLPFVDSAVRLIAGEAEQADDSVDGLCLGDESGRAQWLTAVYRTAARRSAAACVPDGGRDKSMRALLAGLRLATVDAAAGIAGDIDTWDDYDRITKGIS
jgi:molybdopterin-guanine dinucleotide biosynthesis protein A